MCRSKSRLAPVLCLLSCLLLCGCRQQMADQPRYNPYEETDFFADQRSARPVVEGTVARGQLRDDPLLYQGIDPETGKEATQFPFPVTESVLKRGRERFKIFCSLCHGHTGEGNGIIVERGYVQPPSYHIERLREVPHGYIFQVITKGMGAMPDYSDKLKPEDRWAVIAYVRALQMNRAKVDELSESEKKRLPPRKEAAGQ